MDLFIFLIKMINKNDYYKKVKKEKKFFNKTLLNKINYKKLDHIKSII